MAVIVVGASKGIGKEVAKIAAKEGTPVVLIARSPEALSSAAAEARQRGADVFTLELDIVAGDATARLQDFLTSNGLVCDVLVNSAGYGLRGAATALPLKDQLGIIDLNVRALSDLTLYFLPGMVARGRGGVLNLASVASFTPGPNMAVYYASKSFVRFFSEALHQELRGTGVTVTCVAPGPVATEFLERSGANKAPLFKILPKLKPEYVAERAWKGFKSRRRLVVPSPSAKLVAFAAALIPHALILPIIARLQRRSTDPCPCGSGKQYRKCCGAVR